jgi:alkyl sulfatase BDS1-like metallo-beta-lactamase superfamily hydrolase
MSIEHDALAALAAGNRALEALIQDGLAEVTGDRSGLDSVLALLDSFSLGFEIVLP